MRRNSIFTSSVFRVAVGSALSLLVILLTIGWGSFAYVRSDRLDQEENLIRFEAEAAQARFARGGADRLADDIAIEGDRLWDEDWLYYALEEGEFIFRLLEGDDDTVAGYEGLHTEWDWGEAELEHDELDGHPLIGTRLGLGDDYTLMIARFMPDELFGWNELLAVATLILLVFVLPLSLISGYLLTRSVYGRLATLADTADAVGEGSLDTRVPLRGQGDEFDRVGEALNNMLERIAVLTRNMRSVSVGVAHDLKTPISNIDGRLQLIERDLDDPDAISTHLDRAREHIGTLQRTLDALLRLGEIEAGARKAAFSLVDLSALAGDLVESFSPVLSDLDKSLKGDIGESLLVFGDRDLLSQLIINLLENVGEHARDGADAWLQLRRDGNAVLLIVGDDGPGVPDHLRERLFERFVQLDTTRQSSGNGLGLSIVRAIAELHDGRVTLRHGTRGAVFEVRLPASR